MLGGLGIIRVDSLIMYSFRWGGRFFFLNNFPSTQTNFHKIFFIVILSFVFVSVSVLMKKCTQLFFSRNFVFSPHSWNTRREYSIAKWIWIFFCFGFIVTLGESTIVCFKIGFCADDEVRCEEEMRVDFYSRAWNIHRNFAKLTLEGKSIRPKINVNEMHF